MGDRDRTERIYDMVWPATTEDTGNRRPPSTCTYTNTYTLSKYRAEYTEPEIPKDEHKV